MKVQLVLPLVVGLTVLCCISSTLATTWTEANCNEQGLNGAVVGRVTDALCAKYTTCDDVNNGTYSSVSLRQEACEELPICLWRGTTCLLNRDAQNNVCSPPGVLINPVCQAITRGVCPAQWQVKAACCGGVDGKYRESLKADAGYVCCNTPCEALEVSAASTPDLCKWEDHTNNTQCGPSGKSFFGGDHGYAPGYGEYLPPDAVETMFGLRPGNPIQFGAVNPGYGYKAHSDYEAVEAIEEIGVGKSKEYHTDEITVDDLMDALISALNSDTDVFESATEINSDPWFGKQAFSAGSNSFKFIDPYRFIDQIYGSPYGLSQAKLNYGQLYGVEEERFGAPSKGFEKYGIGPPGAEYGMGHFAKSPRSKYDMGSQYGPAEPNVMQYKSVPSYPSSTGGTYLKPMQYTNLGSGIQYMNQGPAMQYTNLGPAMQYTNPGPAMQYTNPGPAMQYTNPGPAMQYTKPEQPMQYTNPEQPMQYTNPEQPMQYKNFGPALQYPSKGLGMDYPGMGQPMIRYPEMGQVPVGYPGMGLGMTLPQVMGQGMTGPQGQSPLTMGQAPADYLTLVQGLMGQQTQPGLEQDYRMGQHGLGQEHLMGQLRAGHTPAGLGQPQTPVGLATNFLYQQLAGPQAGPQAVPQGIRQYLPGQLGGLPQQPAQGGPGPQVIDPALIGVYPRPGVSPVQQTRPVQPTHPNLNPSGSSGQLPEMTRYPEPNGEQGSINAGHGAPQPGPQYPAQPQPGQQYLGQPQPGPQYPGQPQPGPQYPGQPGPGQEYPGPLQYPGPEDPAATNRFQPNLVVQQPGPRPGQVYQPGQGGQVYQPGQGGQVYQPGQGQGYQPGQGQGYQPGQGEVKPGQGQEQVNQPGQGQIYQPGTEGQLYQPRPKQEQVYQPGQGQVYLPGQGEVYQPGSEGQVYQPGQGEVYQPGQGQIYQPRQGEVYQPGQGGQVYQPGQGTNSQPGQGEVYQPQGQVYQPGQQGQVYQPGQGPNSQKGPSSSTGGQQTAYPGGQSSYEPPSTSSASQSELEALMGNYSELREIYERRR